MRRIIITVVLAVLLGACGSKGALVMPPTPSGERPQSQSQSDSNKQN